MICLRGEYTVCIRGIMASNYEEYCFDVVITQRTTLSEAPPNRRGKEVRFLKVFAGA